MTGALVPAVLLAGSGALVALLARSAERALAGRYEPAEGSEPDSGPGRRRRSAAPEALAAQPAGRSLNPSISRRG